MSETTELRALLAEVRELLAAGSDAETLARATVARRTVEACAQVEEDPEKRPGVVLVAMPLTEVDLDFDSVKTRIESVTRLHGPTVAFEPGGVSVELLYGSEGYDSRAKLTRDGCLVFRAWLAQDRELKLATEDFCHLVRVLAAEVEGKQHVLVAGRLLSAEGLGFEGMVDEVRRTDRVQSQSVRLPDRVKVLKDDAIDVLEGRLRNDFAHALRLPPGIWS